jgi:hypothetical protein
VGEVAELVAELPQPVVRFRSVVAQVTDQGELKCPRLGGVFEALLTSQVEGNHHLSQAVGLKLADRLVTDSDRT